MLSSIFLLVSGPGPFSLDASLRSGERVVETMEEEDASFGARRAATR